MTRIDQHVVLVDQGQVLGRTRLRLLEGIAHDSLHPVGGVDAHLRGDLVNSSHTDRSPVAAVQPLGALADDYEVNIAGVRQRSGHTRVVRGGAQIHVMVQGEAQAQQQPAFEDAGGDRGIADGAEEDDVMILDGIEIRVCERLAGAAPAFGSKVEVGGGELDTGTLQDGSQNFESLGNDLSSNAVPGDHCQPDGLLLHLDHEPTLCRAPLIRDEGSEWRAVGRSGSSPLVAEP